MIEFEQTEAMSEADLEARVTQLEAAMAATIESFDGRLLAAREAILLLVVAVDRLADTGVVGGSRDLPEDIGPILRSVQKRLG